MELKIFSVPLAIGLASLLQATAQTTLNDGLVAYYPFNGNANDESRYGNNGVPEGSPDYVVGVRGSAIRFRGGSDKVICGNPSDGHLSFTENEDFAISCWVKTGMQLVWDSWTTVLYKHTYQPFRKGFILLVYPPSTNAAAPGDATFEMWGDTPPSGCFSPPINDNRWHHIVAQRAGAQSSIYVDDILCMTSVGSSPDLSNDADLIIGGALDLFPA